MTTRQPSLERGCDGKANLGRSYRKSADRLAAKHGKTYGVYLCPHCGGTHLTTKLEKAGAYAVPLLYITQENHGQLPRLRTRQGPRRQVRHRCRDISALRRRLRLLLDAALSEERPRPQRAKQGLGRHWDG
jgi:hypothetical protein